MLIKSRVSLIVALWVVAFALACDVAFIPGLTYGASSDVYNLTVGGTLVGEDSTRWQGEGEARAYVYEGSDFSYAYYPSSSTLKLNGGTITGYYEYNNGTKDQEVGGVVSVNCIDSSSMALTGVENLSIEVAQDTKVLISQHAATNVDPSAKAFSDSSLKVTAAAAISGPGTLTISTDGAISSCTVIGLMFDKVELSADEPAHIVFDSIKCSCTDEDGFCNFDGIVGNTLTSIGQGCTVEFNSVETISAGKANFTGISGRETVVESGAQVTLHNVKYSCGETAGVGYSYVALFHTFGDFTSKGDIRIAPDADDEMSVSLANKNSLGKEKTVVAGVTIDYQAANANVLISGTFVMNNVTITDKAFTRSVDQGELYFQGINNASRYGSTSLTGLDFTFNEYGKSSVTIGGKSNAVLAVRAVDEFKDLKVKDSVFDITLPKVDATYLCDSSDVAGFMVCAGDMAISGSTIDVRYSDISLEEESSFKGHAGLVAANGVALGTTSRCTVKGAETGEMAGIAAAVVTLADDAMLTVQAPKGKPAIINGLTNASYRCIGEDAQQQSLGEQALSDAAEEEIVSLAEGYNPSISYGADAQTAVSATQLVPEQYGENAYFAIRNADYDYQVSFDSQGGSAVEAQTVHNLALAQRPTDPVRTGYTFEGWYVDADCTESYDFDVPVTGDITLYAKWSADESDPEADDSGSKAVPATGDSEPAKACLALVLAALALMIGAGVRLALQNRRNV